MVVAEPTHVSLMEQIASKQKQIEEAQAAFDTDKLAMQDEIKQLLSTIALQTIDDKALGLKAIWELYWRNQYIPSGWIEEAFDLPGPVWRVVGGAQAFECANCGFAIELKSRSDYKRALKYEILCSDCLSERNAERESEWQKLREAREQRLHTLATMPYREYLETPEWKERAAAHRKRSWYRCQVCNGSGRTLNIHHRTYERRGNEEIKDLICLCQDCHYLFHRQGKLPPDED